MSQNANTACLRTTVKNVSGKTRSFGFLGAHGMRLAPDEIVTVSGNLIEKLGGTLSQRRFQALEKSLDTNGSLMILSTPAVFVRDETDDRTRQIALDNGVLGVTDPCWESSGSSNFATADS